MLVLTSLRASGRIANLNKYESAIGPVLSNHRVWNNFIENFGRVVVQYRVCGFDMKGNKFHTIGILISSTNQSKNDDNATFATGSESGILTRTR